MKLISLLATIALGLSLTACGSSSSSSSTASGSVSRATSTSGTAASSTDTTNTTQTSGLAAGGTIHVVMKNLSFQPSAINVKVGDTVVFTNDDTPPHNVTYVSGPKFTSSPQLNPGDSFRLVVTQAGTIHYFCSIHPFMKGTIVVTK